MGTTLLYSYQLHMLSNIALLYRRLFSLKEIEDSQMVKWLFGTVLLSFFVTFYGWTTGTATSISAFTSGTHVCPPYFATCGEYYFFQSLPYGYSQNAFYIILFAVAGGVALSMWRNKWIYAHLGLLSLFLWKVAFLYFLTNFQGGNYDHYDMLLAFVILFLPHKVFFARATFVTLYFMSGILKLDEGWVDAKYLNNLVTGVPVFATFFPSLVTRVVILMQLFGSWFLLSNAHSLRTLAFAFFFAFHAYSGLLVGYRYLTIAFTSVVVLFWMFQKSEPTVVPKTKASFVGYVFLLSLVTLQLIPLFQEGDFRLTLERNKYHLFMFEANHQCDSKTILYYTDGSTDEIVMNSDSARMRCDPYNSFFIIKTLCERNKNIARVAFTFDHSINGNPYLRIVDVPNVCELDYKPFTHNEWIKTSEDNPEVIRQAEKNFYY